MKTKLIHFTRTAALGLACFAASAQAQVVPADCGPYSGAAAPPAGYNVVDMPTLGNVYNDAAGVDDFVIGTTGADVITTGGGDDFVCARGGADYVDAGAGNDEVYLGDGADEGYGGPDDDFVGGGARNDYLVGDSVAGPIASDGEDTLQGGTGNDEMFGRGLNDILRGGENVGDFDSGDGEGGADTCNSTVENPVSC